MRFLQSLGKRLVFIAWETNFESYTPAGQQITQAVPDIRKTIRDNVAGLCQVVARLVFNEKSGKRGFILSPSNNVFAKNQLDNREHCLQEELFTVGMWMTEFKLYDYQENLVNQARHILLKIWCTNSKSSR